MTCGCNDNFAPPPQQAVALPSDPQSFGRVQIAHRSTRDSIDNRMPVFFDFDDSGSGIPHRFVMPCTNMVSAAAQVELSEGTASAFVLTVIVSCDPEGLLFRAHPSTITLSASKLVTEVFSVAGYLHFGVYLSTVNTGNLKGHIYLVCKDAAP